MSALRRSRAPGAHELREAYRPLRALLVARGDAELLAVFDTFAKGIVDAFAANWRDVTEEIGVAMTEAQVQTVVEIEQKRTCDGCGTLRDELDL